MASTISSEDTPAAAGARGQPGRFTLFPQLPAELRLKVWQQSFNPRTVELHSRRTHYAQTHTPRWHSSCGNPAALAVCAESRAEALPFYSVPLPIGDNGRLLYLNPAVDTVVILGELDFRRLAALFGTASALDPTRRGLQRVGLSVTCWRHEFAGATLRIWAKTLFSQLEQFILVMYTEQLPPPGFSGGECVLEDCQGMDHFLRFVMGQGREFKSDGAWMVVGKMEMHISELRFVSGPAARAITPRAPKDG